MVVVSRRAVTLAQSRVGGCLLPVLIPTNLYELPWGEREGKTTVQFCQRRRRSREIDVLPLSRSKQNRVVWRVEFRIPGACSAW